MAGIEVIASIIGLAGAGIQVSIALFDLADRIGSAGEEVRLVAIELILFSNVLEAVRVALDDGEKNNCTPAAYQLIEQVVQHCTTVVEDIRSIASSLKREDGNDFFPSLEWTDRVKWTFKKSKIQVKRQTLESCKSTLHLLLTTMRWSRRFPAVNYYDAPGSEVEQYPMLTQGLVLAVRSAVNQLRALEEADDVDQDNLPKDVDRSRFSGLLNGLSLNAKKPVAQDLKRRRTSVWLDKLVFDDDGHTGIHPGMRQQRLSSATTAKDPLLLLNKWTENRPRRALVQPDPDIQDLFHKSNFDFGLAKVDENQDEPPKLPRAPTKLISPKSTISLPKAGLPIATTVAFPALDTFIDTKWSGTTSDQWLSFLLADLGLAEKRQDYELAVVFGGTVKVLPPSEKPYAMVEDLTKYDLKPQLLVQRHVPEAGYASERMDVTISPTTVTFVDTV
ncbi:hypothetical protein OHC33_002884 [Knufia fluminis]|uniref:Fungal N-terminal domain-containing protein n=1 Tax=Knufia fluminis TaxID=191047 RepID=A0AAN8F474_9EURO|nr:hypothetical protein OHC33_002884 [Knufia fluminis]